MFKNYKKITLPKTYKQEIGEKIYSQIVSEQRNLMSLGFSQISLIELESIFEETCLKEFLLERMDDKTQDNDITLEKLLGMKVKVKERETFNNLIDAYRSTGEWCAGIVKDIEKI